MDDSCQFQSSFILISTIFSERDFYQAFANDLKQAKFVVLVQSPFLSKSRVSKIEATLKNCVSRRVRLCIFVQKAREAAKHKDNVVLAKRLREIGAHVSFRSLVHEKIAIIDDEILWDGSLNILSQSTSRERMTRIRSRTLVLDAIKRHDLDRCDACFMQHSRTLLSCQTELDQVKSIGLKVSLHRKNLQMTQTELALKVGLPQSVISQLENGKLNVGLSKLLRVCSALNLELTPVPWHVIPVLGTAVYDF